MSDDAEDSGTAIGGRGRLRYSVQPTLDGGYIIAGATSSFGATGKDVFLVKTNAAADTIWSRRYGGAGDDEGSSVRQTSDGGYIIAGFTSSFGAGGYDIYLVRTNASGETLWTRTFGGTGEDKASSVLALSDGFIVAGWTFFASPQTYDAFLLRTDVAGNQLWMRTFGGTNDDKVTSARVGIGWRLPDGRVHRLAGAGNYDLWLLRTDAAGETLWTRTFGGAQSDQGWSVAQTVDGGCVAAGHNGELAGRQRSGLPGQDRCLGRRPLDPHLW